MLDWMFFSPSDLPMVSFVCSVSRLSKNGSHQQKPKDLSSGAGTKSAKPWNARSFFYWRCPSHLGHAPTFEPQLETPCRGEQPLSAQVCETNLESEKCLLWKKDQQLQTTNIAIFCWGSMLVFGRCRSKDNHDSNSFVHCTVTSVALSQWNA